jgi:hypothetical protein
MVKNVRALHATPLQKWKNITGIEKHFTKMMKNTSKK